MVTIKNILQKFWKTLDRIICLGSKGKNTKMQNGNTSTSNNTEISSKKTVITNVKINDFDKSFVNDDNTVIVNGKKITVGKTPKNVTNYFDEKENGNIQFIELTFQVKKF